jgi:AcrR family transcriptional regulator
VITRINKTEECPVIDDTAKPARKRQARGEKRVAELLDAAAEVFAAQGYAKASTNAIAAAAGASPGTLYQFFKNKEAIAEALMARYVERLRTAHGEAFDPAVAELPLGEMLDRIIDPVVAFDRANPGFHALLSDPHLSPELASAKRPAQKLMFERLDHILAKRAPGLEPARRARTAEVAVHLFRGLLPLIMGAADEELPALVAETKEVLFDYLSPRVGALPRAWARQTRLEAGLAIARSRRYREPSRNLRDPRPSGPRPTTWPGRRLRRADRTVHRGPCAGDPSGRQRPTAIPPGAALRTRRAGDTTKKRETGNGIARNKRPVGRVASRIGHAGVETARLRSRARRGGLDRSAYQTGGHQRRSTVTAG